MQAASNRPNANSVGTLAGAGRMVSTPRAGDLDPVTLDAGASGYKPAGYGGDADAACAGAE